MSALARSIERVIGIGRQAVKPDVGAVAVELDLSIADLWHGSHRLCGSPVTKAFQSPRCGVT
jgi:hypothetical protein